MTSHCAGTVGLAYRWEKSQKEGYESANRCDLTHLTTTMIGLQFQQWYIELTKHGPRFCNTRPWHWIDSVLVIIQIDRIASRWEVVVCSCIAELTWPVSSYSSPMFHGKHLDLQWLLRWFQADRPISVNCTPGGWVNCRSRACQSYTILHIRIASRPSMTSSTTSHTGSEATITAVNINSNSVMSYHDHLWTRA